jgi:hypothetical protein
MVSKSSLISAWINSASLAHKKRLLPIEFRDRYSILNESEYN